MPPSTNFRSWFKSWLARATSWSHSSFIRCQPEFSLQGTCNGFVLQNAHHYATILRLPFRGLYVLADLLAFSHSTRCQHSGEGNATLLNQDVGNGVGTVFAKFLVHGGTTGGRG